MYRNYRNLLIRPAGGGGGFAHQEAQAPPHPDWLWRLARHTHRDPAKAAWITGGTHLGNAPDGVFRIGRRREQVAANYVLFSASPEAAVTLCDPPAIASATAPGQLETWTSDPFAADLRTLLLGQVKGRGLRTTNHQQPHRHIRLGNPALLRAQLNQLIKEHGLAARRDHHRT